MNNYSFKELSFGEWNGLCAFEITQIPDQRILESATSSNSEELIASRFRTILLEGYNAYKSMRTSSPQCELSFELLWITEPTDNQLYKADVKLFFLVRCIGDNKENAELLLQIVSSIVQNGLESMSYSYEEISDQQLSQCIARARKDCCASLVKDESIDNLQNQIFPLVYNYDVIVENHISLKYIADTLIEHPNSILSFQIMATCYTHNEASYIEQTVQTLEYLKNGVPLDQISKAYFPLVEKYENKYQYYSNHISGDLFTYNIIAIGTQQSVNSVLSSCFGHLNNSKSGKVKMHIGILDPAIIDYENNLFPLPWAINEAIMRTGRNMSVWSPGHIPTKLFRLPYIIAGEEAIGFFRLPIGSEDLGAGFVVNSTQQKSRKYANNIINSGDIDIGTLRNTNETIGIELKDLTKHGLIIGSPGSGKTTFSIGLMDRLWKEHGIPFLIIEPAKNEYRSLIDSMPELQVFTPGKESISPFVFNPFVPPKNVKLESYKYVLKTAFNAALSLTSPLDKIVDESINNCYSNYRWLDTYTSDDGATVFNIDDYIKCFRQTFEKIGYIGEAKNIGRAGVVRFKSLKQLFDTYSSIDIEDLLTKPTVIELAAIENSEDKALIIMLLLLSILSYVNSNYIGDGNLKNVIMLEEAHVLFDSRERRESDSMSSAEMAKSLVKRMLAEARAYGVGMIIADQSPRKVTADVVGLTDIKLAFRLVEEEDKNIIADSINMSDVQKDRLARLRPGEAFYFYNKLEDPEELITPDYREQKNIEITISDKALHNKMTYWNDKREMLRPYPECKCVSCCQENCEFSRKILARDIAHRIMDHYFVSTERGFDTLKNVFGRISYLVRQELNQEELSHELLLCIKVHLWRNLRYETQIPISEELIENSLRK